MMEHYYPNSAWLCLRKDIFDRLFAYKSAQFSAELGAGAGTALLDHAEDPVS